MKRLLYPFLGGTLMYKTVKTILYWIFALTLLFAILSPLSSCHADADTIGGVTVILDAPTGAQYQSTRYPVSEETNSEGICTFVLEEYANGSAFGVTLEVFVSGYTVVDGNMLIAKQTSGQYYGYDVEHTVIVQ
jgi:hypothetical protein